MSNLALLNFTGRSKRRVLWATAELRWQMISRVYKLPWLDISELTSVTQIDLCEPVLDHICMAPFVDGLAHDDIGAVMRIAKALTPTIVCEIGTAYGNLTTNLLRNCPAAKIYTVNAPAEEQTGQNVTYALTTDEIGTVYRKYGLESRVVQLLVNSQYLDLGKYLTHDVIDLAILDGCHDTQFVINDFEKVRPFVRPGGLVLFHDTHPSERDHLRGSYRACLLLRRDGVDVRWIENTWWGVWRKPL